MIPLLITDPRYVLLPSQAEREAAFNEWCKEAARLARLAKSSASTTSASTASQQQQEATNVDPKVAARQTYDALLSAEVTSTRTTWDDFRRKWKKDRRFFGFGRDEREREKVFRAWVKELGERELSHFSCEPFPMVLMD